MFFGKTIRRFYEIRSRYIGCLNTTNWLTSGIPDQRVRRRFFPSCARCYVRRWSCVVANCFWCFSVVQLVLRKLEATRLCFKMSHIIFSFIRNSFRYVEKLFSLRLWITVMLLVSRSYRLSKRTMVLRDAVEFFRASVVWSFGSSLAFKRILDCRFFIGQFRWGTVLSKFLLHKVVSVFFVGSIFLIPKQKE